MAVSRVTIYSETPMRTHQSRLAALSLASILFALAACSPDTTTSPSASSAARAATGAPVNNADDLNSEGEGLGRLKHIVVIYLENRSFDNLYGEFPGANGLANAGARSDIVHVGGVISVLGKCGQSGVQDRGIA